MEYYVKYGTIIYGEEKRERIQLLPKENKVFSFLLKNKRATNEELKNLVHDNKLEISTQNVIRVNICRINKKIKPIGKIQRLSSFGYELILKGGENEQN